jgi:hypothetical protein
MSPTTSIVIPTHNRGALLEDAVASALEHGGASSELIVVDDRSTDGSVEALTHFGDALRVVRGSFGNAAAARNAGAAATSGTYLAFLDSDDLMLPAKTACLVDALEADRGAALAHGTMEVIDATGSPLPVQTREQQAAFAEGARRGTSYGALAEFCAMFTSATLIRRTAFVEVGGYDETLAAYEDWDLYLRLALSWRLVYSDCLAARYRMWPGNVPWGSTARWTIAVAEKHLNHPPPGKAGNTQARYGFLRRVAESHHILVEGRQARTAALAAVRLAPARALRDPAVMRPLVLSFLPARLLRKRRPG